MQIKEQQQTGKTGRIEQKNIKAESNFKLQSIYNALDN
jgi:hypothetical protein